MNTLIGIVIALIIAGFIFWIAQQVIAIITPYLDPLFAQIVRLLLIVIAVGIIIFYVVIPLLHMLPGISIGIH
jgi:hypothetical protein